MRRGRVGNTKEGQTGRVPLIPPVKPPPFFLLYLFDFCTRFSEESILLLKEERKEERERGRGGKREKQKE